MKYLVTIDYNHKKGFEQSEDMVVVAPHSEAAISYLSGILLARASVKSIARTRAIKIEAIESPAPIDSIKEAVLMHLPKLPYNIRGVYNHLGFRFVQYGNEEQGYQYDFDKWTINPDSSDDLFLSIYRLLDIKAISPAPIDWAKRLEAVRQWRKEAIDFIGEHHHMADISTQRIIEIAADIQASDRAIKALAGGSPQ